MHTQGSFKNVRIDKLNPFHSCNELAYCEAAKIETLISNCTVL